MKIKLSSPPELGSPFAPYSQIADVSASRIVFIAGQVATDRAGNVVGIDEFDAHCQQVTPIERPRVGEEPALAVVPERVAAPDLVDRLGIGVGGSVSGRPKRFFARKAGRSAVCSRRSPPPTPRTTFLPKPASDFRVVMR